MAAASDGSSRDELPNIEIRISSDHSATLADDLQRGKLDVAFLRAEPTADLELIPSPKSRWSRATERSSPGRAGGGRPARSRRRDLHRHIGGAARAARCRSRLFHAPGNRRRAVLEIDNYAMADFARRFDARLALLPASAENFVPWSVVTRPIRETPDDRRRGRLSQGEYVGAAERFWPTSTSWRRAQPQHKYSIIPRRRRRFVSGAAAWNNAVGREKCREV